MTKSPNSFKDQARGISTDMSAQAVAHRMKIMDQLWAAGLKMRKVRRDADPTIRLDHSTNEKVSAQGI